MTLKTPLSAEPDTHDLDAPAPVLITYADGVATLDGVTIGYTEDCDRMVGRDLVQTGFQGLAPAAPNVFVGPCHAAYVAINLAVQGGAQAVTVEGLSEAEKTQFTPWIAAIAHEVAVQLT